MNVAEKIAQQVSTSCKPQATTKKYWQRIKLLLHLLNRDTWHRRCRRRCNKWKNVGNEELRWSLLHVTLKVGLKRQLQSRGRTTCTFCKTINVNCFQHITYLHTHMLILSVFILLSSLFFWSYVMVGLTSQRCLKQNLLRITNLLLHSVTAADHLTLTLLCWQASDNLMSMWQAWYCVCFENNNYLPAYPQILDSFQVQL